ncbi:MAG: acyl-ACP--UDP-N-acetylglucosamine O-acyltransferase [Spirochaetota bacterium]|nr:MAG: acyl-ACP--UDP-N-acetylglucosamine O-acyltransferase [Spirochaetota bacterium]
MSCVHKTAVIDSSADIGSDNTIGPYVVIDGHVKIGNNNIIDPASIITGNTTIGDNNHIHGHVYIGNLPQDLAHKGGSTLVRIGNNNIIREFTTVHRGTKEGSATIIGDNNYLMVACHVAHNCRLGSDIIMVNAASLGGYVEVHDHAFLGAFVVVHQFCKIGSYSICGILTKITKDIPPFMMVDGNPAIVRGLNLVGLKRKGFSQERRELLKKAYKIIYRSGYSISHSKEELKKLEDNKDIRLLLDFISSSERGILLKSSNDAS